jgi:hypothetical protein
VGIFGDPHARALNPHPPAGPRVIGLDEVSIKKGHVHRIVVSDLLRQWPIWFGGTDRSEASLDQFHAKLKGDTIFATKRAVRRAQRRLRRKQP